VLAAALRENAERDQLPGKIISVDPQPERFPQNGWSKFVVQVPKAIQDVDLDFFRSLGDGDILFIDSSHVVSLGSDVVREYLEILPRLKPGVLVHVHDIFLPADYPRDAVLNRLWFWSEQYLLQAFLTFNPKFEEGNSLPHGRVLQEHCASLAKQPYQHAGIKTTLCANSRRRTRLAIKLLDGPTIGISESTPALISRKFFNTPVENCVEKEGSS